MSDGISITTQDLISWITTAIAVFTAIVMAVKAFRTTPGERADLASKYEQMASDQADQIKEMRGRLDCTEEELEKLKRKLNEWTHGVALLIHQIEAAGLVPLWKPKDTGELKK